MPRIPHADIAAITDPETLDYLEDARLHGTPRPESQAIRGAPPVRRTASKRPSSTSSFPDGPHDLWFTDGGTTQIEELALHATVAPSGVLSGEAKDEFVELVRSVSLMLNRAPACIAIDPRRACGAPGTV